MNIYVKNKKDTVVRMISIFPVCGTIFFMLFSALVSAQEHRYSDFHFGERALGLGGAVAGIVSDPSAAYYNPGGMAFLSGDLFSGSVNFWALDMKIEKGALFTEGENGEKKDLASRMMGFIPTAGAIVKQLAPRHLIAFTTFIPVYEKHSFNGKLIEKGFGTSILSSSLTISESQQLMHMGPSYGFRISPQWGVGISAFYLNNIFERTTAMLFFSQTGAPIDASFFNADSYKQTLYYTKISTHGLRFSVGTIWRPLWGLRIGFNFNTPVIPIMGSAKLSYNASNYIDKNLKVYNMSDEVTANIVLPWSIRFGIGYERERKWAIEADFSYYAPQKGSLFICNALNI